jgi:hypothetical protein
MPNLEARAKKQKSQWYLKLHLPISNFDYQI